jgi:magnesium transporter
LPIWLREPYPTELYDAWPVLADERAEGLSFSKDQADDFFLQLSARDRAHLVPALPPQRKTAVRLLAPDDAVDVIQEAPAEERDGLYAPDDVTDAKLGP